MQTFIETCIDLIVPIWSSIWFRDHSTGTSCLKSQMMSAFLVLILSCIAAVMSGTCGGQILLNTPDCQPYLPQWERCTVATSNNWEALKSGGKWSFTYSGALIITNLEKGDEGFYRLLCNSGRNWVHYIKLTVGKFTMITN